jgi:hypothetical protein
VSREWTRRQADRRYTKVGGHQMSGGALHSAQPAQAQVDASSRMQVSRLERCDALKVHGVFRGFDARIFRFAARSVIETSAFDPFIQKTVNNITHSAADRGRGRRRVRGRFVERRRLLQAPGRRVYPNATPNTIERRRHTGEQTTRNATPLRLARQLMRPTKLAQTVSSSEGSTGLATCIW